ncbi:MAG: hypothetical protein K8S15_01905 [Candidatus Aegiribacteria sp.]|nr:hypothetical protein [Candidatus Aegiribacteria sp.]
MKAIAVLSVAFAALLVACGAQPDQEEGSSASSLDILPENTLFSMAVVNPAAAISSLDGYASGVAILGENAISGWILSALDCSDMSEVKSKLGVDINGDLVFFMESMMPQSIGAALTVSDPDIFWANIGITPEAGEPLDGYEVSKIAVDFGNIYFCYTDGLLLGAGSRAGLQSMLASIDGSLPHGLPGIPDGSFYMYANIASFGPMIASQLAMLEPQILSEMTSDNDMDVELTQNVMGLYFDAISLILTETKSMSCVLSFEPEYITGFSSVEFVPGSSLDQYIIPVENQDMTNMIPAGNVMVGRLSLDPLTSTAAMNAVFSAMNIDNIPQNMVDFWAQTAKNTAISMTIDDENPMHIVAVYEMPEGSSLQDVKDAYDIQFSMLSEVMEMPGLTLSDVQYADYEGYEWITFGMNMDMTALQPDSVVNSMPLTESVAWTAWMTVQDGILYLEMAPEPLTVPQLLDGTYQGETAGEMPEMQSFSSSSEMAMLLNIPGYVNMAIAMSGLEVPPIDSEPVWLESSVDFVDGGMKQNFRVSGTGMTAFIGQVVQVFAAI